MPVDTSSAPSRKTNYRLERDSLKYFESRLFGGGGLLAPYQALMKSPEGAAHLGEMASGMMSDLERKSVEPIARRAGVAPRVLQGFVGIKKWDDGPLRRLQREQVNKLHGSDGAALILDGSSTRKSGKQTVGAKRQWCGNLGKVENCVTGVHAVFCSAEEKSVLVDSEIYLPEEWLSEVGRAAKVHIPEDREYASIPAIGASITRKLAGVMKFGWVLGDSEFGRATELRAEVRALGKHYVMEVPQTTVVTIDGKPVEVRSVVATLETVFLRHGTKGKLHARAAAVGVETAHGKQAIKETLMMLVRPGETQVHFYLAAAPEGMSAGDLARMASRRHRCEQVFAECKGDLGMDHFEVRSFHGWHHHMTIVQVCHWFLIQLQGDVMEKYNVKLTVSKIRFYIGRYFDPYRDPDRLMEWINQHLERERLADEAAEAT